MKSSLLLISTLVAVLCSFGLLPAKQGGQTTGAEVSLAEFDGARATVTGVLDADAFDGSVWTIEGQPFVGNTAALTAADSTIEVHSTKWKSGGLDHEISTPRKWLEGEDEWNERHRKSLESALRVFPLDPPSTGMLFDFYGERERLAA